MVDTTPSSGWLPGKLTAIAKRWPCITQQQPLGKGPDLGPVVKVASDAFPGPIEKLKRSIGLVTLRGVLAEVDGDYLALRHNMRYWRLSTLSPAPLRGLERGSVIRVAS